jgi:hypothetical protein
MNLKLVNQCAVFELCHVKDNILRFVFAITPTPTYVGKITYLKPRAFFVERKLISCSMAMKVIVVSFVFTELGFTELVFTSNVRQGRTVDIDSFGIPSLHKNKF